MLRVKWNGLRVAASVCVLALCGTWLLRAQEGGGISLPTEVRVQRSSWWPTQGKAARGEYVGAEVCADCHEAKVQTQKQSTMAHAASRAKDSEALRRHRRLDLKVGAYGYELATREGQSTLKVSNGEAGLSAELEWALGSAHMGQTFLFRREGKFYESHLSYYEKTQALDITPGQKRTIPASVEDAAGRELPGDEARKCFGCHTTGSTTSGAFSAEAATPGVSCEACHGPGARHVASAIARKESRGSGTIFTPAGLDRVDAVDFCGACHRTWQDVVSGHLIGVGVFNVRFAPYRLENSQCWAKGDARITCVACHDPHKPLVHEAAAYDANCLACHPANARQKRTANLLGKACRVAEKDCVSCHMPKVEPPGLHSAFTDHWIRVLKPGAPYPD